MYIEAMPVVPVRGIVILPNMIMHFDISHEHSVASIEKALIGDSKIFIAIMKDIDSPVEMLEDLIEIGTIAEVKQVTKMPSGIVRVLVEGLERGKVLGLVESDGVLRADIEELRSDISSYDHIRYEAMLRHIKELFERYSVYVPKLASGMVNQVQEQKELEVLMDLLASHLPFSYEDKIKILEAIELDIRYENISIILYNEIELARIRAELGDQIRDRVNKNQREYLLREQLNFIRDELESGEGSELSESEQYEQQLAKIKASSEVKEKIKKEISRFKKVSSNSAESTMARTYIETLLDMPWSKISSDNNDIKFAKEILDRDHFGLEQVKERVLEFLAVRSLTTKGDSPIICLVGPPGTGKTSIAKSVASALHKKYVRISLGGVRDEAEIRGHRKTYIGAMPGRIANGLRQAGVKNPLMLLDEIDKVSSDYKGDTSSALLEVLDSEQNVRFRDNYIELPVDLSRVLFIATANTTTTIPKPLLDRMEIIEVSSYTANEKFHIAKEHLLMKQYERNGMDNNRLTISDNVIKDIIEYYTKEAGVRELERKIGSLCRKCAKEIIEKNINSVIINRKNLSKYLGKHKYTKELLNNQDQVGIVRGLAWTSVGGDTLSVEVNMMSGKGDLDLTGQMGDIMKESAKAGISYIRSISGKYGIEGKLFKENDFHIHIPEGAVPKDGPSAGITMATAILSVVLGTPVKSDVAMTGEITLRGRVLPIGGLKEKLLAAKSSGIKTVIVPIDNKGDVAEISTEIKNGLKIEYVSTMEQVIAHALVMDKDGNNNNDN